MQIPKGYKLVPVEAHVEKGFEVIHGRHVPTIKIMLPACHADDSKAWDRRDAIGSMILSMISAAPAPPQPIYDQAKEREYLMLWNERARALLLSISNNRNYPIGWAKQDEVSDLLSEHCAQSRAKAGEVGDE